MITVVPLLPHVVVVAGIEPKVSILICAGSIKIQYMYLMTQLPRRCMRVNFKGPGLFGPCYPLTAFVHVPATSFCSSSL